MLNNKVKKLLITLSIGLSIGIVSTNTSFAQSLVAQKDYIPLNIDSTQTLVNPIEGKPVLIEFFWYGCPHCYHMEPLVKKLMSDRKNDFTFKRYPVVLPRWDSGAKLYFTLEEMGLADKLHDKVFSTIQQKHINIMDNKVLRDEFLKSEGVDIVKFDSVYNSFGIGAKLNKAKTFVGTYKIDSSPVFVINNAYQVSPGLTGSYDTTISSINRILDKVKNK